MRAVGAMAASLALLVTMTADRPTTGSLGLGLLGVAAFAISCLFKRGGPAPSRAPQPVPRPSTPEQGAPSFAGYGLGVADDAAKLHPALMAGVPSPRR